jgi:hypothetical protein
LILVGALEIAVRCRFDGFALSSFASVFTQHYVLPYIFAFGLFGFAQTVCEDKRHLRCSLLVRYKSSDVLDERLTRFLGGSHASWVDEQYDNHEINAEELGG